MSVPSVPGRAFDPDRITTGRNFFKKKHHFFLKNIFAGNGKTIVRPVVGTTFFEDF